MSSAQLRMHLVPLVRHLGRKVDEIVLKIKNIDLVMGETHQVHPSAVHLASHLLRTGLQ